MILFTGNGLRVYYMTTMKRNCAKLLLGLVAVALANESFAADYGSIDTNYVANVSGTAYVVKVQADGNALVGGKFAAINGVPQSNMLRR